MTLVPDGSGTQQRIVVVEDADSASLLERMLHAAGYENVRTAAAPAVLDVLLDRWDPDLVVLDLQLPNLDGFALLQRIVALDIPCLVLTADDTPTTRRRALGLGARAFGTTPLDRVELLLRRVRNRAAQ